MRRGANAIPIGVGGQIRERAGVLRPEGLDLRGDIADIVVADVVLACLRLDLRGGRKPGNQLAQRSRGEIRLAEMAGHWRQTRKAVDLFFDGE